MVRALPIVFYEGKHYFFDERLRQLRATNNPHDFINLNDFELEYFKGLKPVKNFAWVVEIL